MIPLLLLSLLTHGADWPRFRGPNGAGTSDDRSIPSVWKEENILWKAAVGSGHSSPIVSKGKVFLVSATQKERTLHCLDAFTGRVEWTRSVPGARGKHHPKSSLASATPSSDGERVFAVFWDGESVEIRCFRHDGEPVWKQPLGKFKSQHGPGFSPVVIDGKVLVHVDQDGKAELRAFHARDGKPAWSVDRKAYRACYSTPFQLKDGTVVVTATLAVTGYDPADGKERWNYSWKFPGKPLRTVGSSVAADGLLFCCSGDGDGSRNMVAVRLGEKGELPSSATVWQLDAKTPYVPTILASGSHLYTVNDTGFAVCREMKTGKQAWELRLPSEVSASPVLISGRMFVFGEKGDVTVIEASPDRATVLARNKLPEGVMSSPAVANGRLYVRGSNHLFCIGVPEMEKPKVEARIYELRVYYVLPGRMDAMNARFRDHTCKLFEKHGMKLIGFWQPSDPKEKDRKLIYVLSHASREAADKSWKAFREDPDWIKARDASERDGKIVEKIESTFMSPTDYSYLK
jgi:outer membrane protein assembly factor BamB